MDNPYKYIIIGFNCSGKMTVAQILRGYGVLVGDTFRSVENVGNQYSLSTIVYETKEVNNMFENQSYFFMKESALKSDRHRYYEGISFYEYQNKDVFVMTPDQFNMISKFDDNVIFVWLDTNAKQRRYTHRIERRKYDFNNQERIEQEYVQDFTSRIGDNKLLYFFNEDPERVATILYGLIQHPDLVPKFLQTFN